MARPQKKPDYDAENLMKQLIDEVAEAYLHPRGKFPGKNGRMSLDALGDEFSMSSLKIRKLLVTAGVYDTPLCRRVQEWYESGKSVKEICGLTGLSAASVSGYLPYRRTVYKLKERTLLAERLVRYRERKQAVSRLEDLLADGSAEEIFCAVWDAICLFAGYPFETVQGLRFCYEVRGKEIFFSRKEKSVTEASVRKAVKTALELQRQGCGITGPKKLNCFGASYLYPVLIRIGLIDLQEEAKMPEEGMPDA